MRITRTTTRARAVAAPLLAAALITPGAVAAHAAEAPSRAAAPAPGQAMPKGHSCDPEHSDWWGDAKLYPGDKRYNPRHPERSGPRTKVQLWQEHIAWEDTYAIAHTYKPGVRIYIEDRKSQQKCWSERSSDWPGGYEIETDGVLDNRNTSVRVVIVDPLHGKKYGRWAREDAGGHWQPWENGGRGKIDGSPDYDRKAKVNYDENERPGLGQTLPRKYDARYGHITRGSIVQNSHDEGGADESYGSVTTKNPNMTVSLQSDKYGQGKWHKVRGTGGGWYKRHTGILYNKHDALRVCVKQAKESAPTCGKWHKG